VASGIPENCALSDSRSCACPTGRGPPVAYARRHHDLVASDRNAARCGACNEGTTVGGALVGLVILVVRGSAVALPATAAQLRSARGAGALLSLGIAPLESIGAAFGREPVAGDDGRPGSAAAGVGLLLCAPGVTGVAFGSVGVGVGVGVVGAAGGVVVLCASA
jgi:hypothetical protein